MKENEERKKRGNVKRGKDKMVKGKKGGNYGKMRLKRNKN